MWQADLLDPSVKRREVGSVTLARALGSGRPRVSSQISCECEYSAPAEASVHGGPARTAELSARRASVW